MASATFGDKSGPGGIVHNPASAHSREMAKWEMEYSPYGPPGRPRHQVGHHEWPAMFYKVHRDETSGKIVTDHYLEAKDEAEGRNLQSRGYVRGLGEAHEALKASEQQLAVAAAERAFSDRRMGEKAKAEVEQAEAATGQHVGEIPVTPIRKRGRPVKVKKSELVNQS